MRPDMFNGVKNGSFTYIDVFPSVTYALVPMNMRGPQSRHNRIAVSSIVWGLRVPLQVWRHAILHRVEHTCAAVLFHSRIRRVQRDHSIRYYNHRRRHSGLPEIACIISLIVGDECAAAAVELSHGA